LLKYENKEQNQHVESPVLKKLIFILFFKEATSKKDVGCGGSVGGMWWLSWLRRDWVNQTATQQFRV
jgi:hypothetical protein